MTNKIKIESGKILIAEPFMGDSSFKHCVICLCEHNEEGSLGFILNRPLNLSLTDLVGNIAVEENHKVYYGGPVATDTIHYIHNLGELLENSVKIKSGVYWGGDFEKLKFLIESGMVQKSNIRFYIGYSGWSSGQLNEEMTTGTWVSSELHANYIFKTKAYKLWQQVLDHKGNTFSVIAQMPKGTSLN